MKFSIVMFFVFFSFGVNGGELNKLDLGQAILAADKKGNFDGIWSVVPETEFYVQIRIQDCEVKDRFEFLVVKGIDNAGPIVMIYENEKLVLSTGNVKIAKMTANQIVVALHPELSIMLRFNGGAINISPKIISEIRAKSTLEFQQKTVNELIKFACDNKDETVGI